MLDILVNMLIYIYIYRWHIRFSIQSIWSVDSIRFLKSITYFPIGVDIKHEYLKSKMLLTKNTLTIFLSKVVILIILK